MIQNPSFLLAIITVYDCRLKAAKSTHLVHCLYNSSCRQQMVLKVQVKSMNPVKPALQDCEPKIEKSLI